MSALTGVYTALVTPFKEGSIDDKAFQELVDSQFQAGVTGVVPMGTTGESPTLQDEEQEHVIKLAIEACAGRGNVIVGTGFNSTEKTIKATQKAEKLGADGALLVCPYYNKPSQEGLYQHYRAVAGATNLPLMLYSIPSRSGIEIEIETVQRLAESCSNIVALKEAGGSVDRVSRLKSVLPEEFTILSGDDPLTLPFLSVGAIGVVSVIANLRPQIMVEMVAQFQKGNIREAQSVHKKYYHLMQGIMALETNPVPIKTAMALTGKMEKEFRLPLVPLSPEKEAVLKTLLQNYQII